MIKEAADALAEGKATDIIVIGGAASVGLVLTVRKIWRTISQERVDTFEDSSRISIIKTLREENRLLREENSLLRERTDMAFGERNRALEEASLLRSQLAMLHRDVSDLQLQISLLTGRIADMPKATNPGK